MKMKRVLGLATAVAVAGTMALSMAISTSAAALKFDVPAAGDVWGIKNGKNQNHVHIAGSNANRLNKDLNTSNQICPNLIAKVTFKFTTSFDCGPKEPGDEDCKGQCATAAVGFTGEFKEIKFCPMKATTHEVAMPADNEYVEIGGALWNEGATGTIEVTFLDKDGKVLAQGAKCGGEECTGRGAKGDCAVASVTAASTTAAGGGAATTTAAAAANANAGGTTGASAGASPKAGVTGVAALGGMAILSAGAMLVTKKRK